MSNYFQNDILIQHKKFDKEYKIINITSGQEKWVHGLGSLKFDDNRKPVELFGTIQDVTERKKAEDVLKESRERMKLAFKGADLGIWDYNILSDELILDERSIELIGAYPKNEAEAESLVHPDDLKQYIDIWDAVIEGREASYIFEYRKKNPSAQYKWLMDKGKIVERDINGKPTRATGTLQDITKQKQTEKKLRDSEKRSRAWLESSPVCTKMLDLDFNLQYMSAAGINGLNIDDITQFYGKPYPFDFYPESFRNLMTMNLEKVKETGDILEQEGSVVDINGNDLWFHSTLVPVNDDEGRIDYIIVVSVDITERKQAENALKDSEERLKSFYDAAFEGIALTRQGKIIDVNKRICELFGYERDELIGREVLGLVAEEDRELVIKNIKSNSKKPYEHRSVHKDGSIIFLEVKGQQIQFKGQPARVTAIHDISESKHSEAALRESEEKYRLLVEDINDVIYRTDQNGIITYVSPVVKSFAGYDPSELIGQPFIKIIYEKDIELLTDKFQDLISGVTRPLTYRVVNKANEPIWVRSSSKLIYDGKNIVGVRGVITDISEEKRLQFQLEQALKMEAIGTLAGGIAHDFNNILSAVIGFSELALGKTSKDPKLYDNIKQVLKAGHRAKDLVTQILSFSRKGTQEQKPINIIPLVKETVKLIRASLPTTIEIRQNYKTDPGVIMADPTQLHQVLMNLCTNAGGAMRDTGGILEVKLTKADLDSKFATLHQSIEPGPHVLLAVSDTGHGMPPAVLERIFEPYFTTKERGEGTGMGLAVVHGIIENHRGAITVESKPGKGSTFYVYLPLVEEEEKPETRVEEPIPMGTECILFIDDEEVVIDLSKQMLEELGYKVETKTSSVEALESWVIK